MTNGIVIPCYNESSRLDLMSYLRYAHTNKANILCFVNDGSSDETRATLADIKNMEYDNVHIFNLSENGGKAKAVQQGALYLYNETDVETIGFIDADLSTDFDDYHGLVDTMRANPSLKVIYGSRAQDGENNIKRNFVRNIISTVIRYIILCITRLKIQDTQCGAKVFHRSLVPFIFNEEFKTRWLFDVEILLRLKKKMGIKYFKGIFLEKPLQNWVHMDGSKLGMKDAISIPVSLLKIWIVYDVLKPLKTAVMAPIKTFVSHFRNNYALKLIVTVLATFELFLFSTGNRSLNHPLNYIHLVIPAVYTLGAFYTVLKKHMKRSRRWRWIVGHTNTVKRRFTETY